MAAARSLWSERFLAINTNGVGYSYVVPAGHRAVIMTVTLVAGATTVAEIEVSAGGIYLVRSSVPGKETKTWTDLRCVVYAGQSIVGFTPTANAYAGVHGYLLVDDGLGLALAVEEFAAKSSSEAMAIAGTERDER